MDANPKIALVATPVEVAIDSGSAKNARYTRLGPSIRNSRPCSVWEAGGAALVRVLLAIGGHSRGKPLLASARRARRGARARRTRSAAALRGGTRARAGAQNGPP